MIIDPCDVVCNCDPETCDDFRCRKHHNAEIQGEIINKNKAKKQLKRYCIPHHQPFYTECQICIQVETRNALLDLLNEIRSPGQSQPNIS